MNTGQDSGKARQAKFVPRLTHRAGNMHRVLAPGDSLLRDAQLEVAVCDPDSISRGLLPAKRLNPWDKRKAAEPVDSFFSF